MSHLIAISVAVVCGFRAEFVQLFEPHEFTYTGGDCQCEVVNYRLFIPNASSARQPLIIWLHGFGEAGSDNIRQLLWLEELICIPPIRRDRFPFFLLAVQCPRDNPYWTSIDHGAEDMIDVVKAVADEVVHKYPIDKQRIYLAGISSGGVGCWTFASRHPDNFAAVAPMASSVNASVRLERLTDIPVWAFHSKSDSATSIESVRVGVERLQNAGGTVHLTEIASSEHDCWNAAFHDYHLLEWLLSQRQGSEGPLPGSVSVMSRFRDFAGTWEWWQIAAQIGLFAGIIAVSTVVIRWRGWRGKSTPQN